MGAVVQHSWREGRGASGLGMMGAAASQARKAVGKGRGRDDGSYLGARGAWWLGMMGVRVPSTWRALKDVHRLGTTGWPKPIWRRPGG